MGLEAEGSRVEETGMQQVAASLQGCPEASRGREIGLQRVQTEAGSREAA